jgi:iron complex transport system permease protein
LSKKHQLYFVVLALVAIVLVLVELASGSEWISFSDIIQTLKGNHTSNAHNFIVHQLRIPRAFTSVLVGAALSVSGLLMQSLFKNGLAGPYVLGISSGSGLGVALLMMAGTAFGIVIDSSITLVIASSLGSLLVLLIVLALSFRVRQAASLLIIGVMIGTFVSSIISVLQFFTDMESLKKFVLWTMGSTTSTTMQQNGLLLIFVLFGVLIAVFLSKSLNAFLMGEDYAKSVGVSVKNTRVWSIVAVALMAGSVTAYCGPIAFIGLAVPHVARNIFNTSLHQILIPASVLLGVCFMLACDIISQLPGFDYVLPINAVTSLIGAPIVISVILKNQSIA